MRSETAGSLAAQGLQGSRRPRTRFSGKRVHGQAGNGSCTRFQDGNVYGVQVRKPLQRKGFRAICRKRAHFSKSKRVQPSMLFRAGKVRENAFSGVFRFALESSENRIFRIAGKKDAPLRSVHATERRGASWHSSCTGRHLPAWFPFRCSRYPCPRISREMPMRGMNPEMPLPAVSLSPSFRFRAVLPYPW